MRTSVMIRKASLIVYAVLWTVSFVIAANLNSLNSGSLFFLLCSGGSAVYLMRQNIKDERARYKIILWLITIYFSFAFYGRSIFMQNERLDFSWLNLCCFIVFCIVFYPLTPGILALFERLSQKKQHSISTAKIKEINTGLICGFTIFAVDFILTLSNYPCTMTNDSRGHWLQALSPYPLNDYSPLAFNLLLKGLFTITGFTTPYIYVLFQTIVFSLIVGDTANFLHRLGVGRKMLIAGSLVFAFLPSTYMLLLYLSKNPLSGILCLGVVSCLLQLITETEYYLKKWTWYVKTVVLILALYLIRENNMVIFIPLIIFAIWFLFKNRNLGSRILIVVLGVICSIFFVNNVVYKSIDYVHVDKSHETIRPLLSPVGSALKQELPLPDDIYKTAERVLPAEEWIKRYDPFNSDEITWVDPMPQYTEVSLKEGLSVYFKMLRLYPDVVIKDRLDGMDCVWNINVEIEDKNKCPTVVYDDVSFKDAKLPDGLICDIAERIKGLTSKLLDISRNEEILDTFIWRNGIFVYLLMVASFFLVRKKKAKLLWAILPSVFILLTYVLVIAWQMYFYLWFFPLSVTLLIIVAILECGKHAETSESDLCVNREDK